MNMSPAEAKGLSHMLIAGVEHELQTTRKVLAAIPENQLDFKLGTRVVGISEAGDGLSLELDGAERQTLAVDVVLVSVGRRPYTEGLGLEALGIARDPQGRVIVDDGFATNIPGIYAIGDVIRGPMLAHKAEEEGIALAERLAGTLPDPLSVCFFVCSGSEANELALRLARAATGGRDVVVVDGAYHGNTQGLVDVRGNE